LNTNTDKKIPARQSDGRGNQLSKITIRLFKRKRKKKTLLRHQNEKFGEKPNGGTPFRPLQQKRARLLEKDTPGIKDKKNDNTTNPTRATAFRIVKPDDAAPH